MNLQIYFYLSQINLKFDFLTKRAQKTKRTLKQQIKSIKNRFLASKVLFFYNS